MSIHIISERSVSNDTSFAINHPQDHLNIMLLEMVGINLDNKLYDRSVALICRTHGWLTVVVGTQRSRNEFCKGVIKHYFVFAMNGTNITTDIFNNESYNSYSKHHYFDFGGRCTNRCIGEHVISNLIVWMKYILSWFQFELVQIRRWKYLNQFWFL